MVIFDKKKKFVFDVATTSNVSKFINSGEADKKDEKKSNTSRRP